jgi:hypothetical protein
MKRFYLTAGFIITSLCLVGQTCQEEQLEAHTANLQQVPIGNESKMQVWL